MAKAKESQRSAIQSLQNYACETVEWYMLCDGGCNGCLDGYESEYSAAKGAFDEGWRVHNGKVMCPDCLLK